MLPLQHQLHGTYFLCHRSASKRQSAKDEEEVRRLVAMILEQHGYRVLAAPNGEEAIRMFEQCGHPIDLLISDVVMPRMRGPELVDHLRRGQPEIHILFISGYTDSSIKNQQVSGEAHFLQKPFAVDALMRAVNEALKSNGAPG